MTVSHECLVFCCCNSIESHLVRKECIIYPLRSMEIVLAHHVTTTMGKVRLVPFSTSLGWKENTFSRRVINVPDIYALESCKSLEGLETREAEGALRLWIRS